MYEVAGDGDDSSPPQGVLQKARRFCSEGHTAWDAFLSIATASVGQVILTYPYQVDDLSALFT